ncbi:flagellar hook-length control protein FliK [Limnohabitans sp. MMS-10A-178]|uniref:flagellar hook-length control protein FliK n=1 Tax=Limnohabitans sp. MMS-10A-178 TaxID=1835767 RepID=UPI000D361530|nr:flagellar hook-length control protein FliK [Limnohabitans sp. MMS-10A-178]PUE16467.1 hypothetical protein B9Z32_02385 [Limnohabitans sp. MMS-10A-178]
MAIFVSNPPSAAAPTLSIDALDPAALAPEEGFTQELAAAMQAPAGLTEVPANLSPDNSEDAAKKASDLQILPAEVLMNAVGDANFALTGQAGLANSTGQDLASGTLLTDATEALKQDTTALDLANSLQGAELAAANLAAQMSTSATNVPVPAAANLGEVSATHSIGAASGAGQDAGQVPQALASGAGSVSSSGSGPGTGSGLQVEAQIASAAQLASPQSSSLLNSESIPASHVSTGNPSAQMASMASAAAELASTPADTAQAQNALTAPASNTVKPAGLQAEAVIFNQASLPAASPMVADPSFTLKSEANSASTNGVDQKSTSVANPTLAVPINSANAAQSLAVGNLAAEKKNTLSDTRSDSRTDAISDTKAEAQVSQTQETAFNFDAKLSKSDAPLLQAGQTSKGNALGLQGGAASSENQIEGVSFSNVQSGIKNEQKGDATGVNRTDLAGLTATSTGLTELVQEAPRPETVQSLDDISSSFVSSLVGGPQRPVTTVMDWISTQSQERVAPLVPHEVRLDAGAIQLEIQKMVKQGGGHVVMELTPPDQSKFTIELKLDERGNALLIVEGVSDSTKTRLEQSAPQLREQFQQMGLELQLDMRQQGQSGSSNAANFADYQERAFSGNQAAGDPSKVMTPRETGAMRARETGSNQVYLYA